MENKDNMPTEIEDLKKRNFILKMQFAQSKQVVKLYEVLTRVMDEFKEEAARKRLNNVYGK